MPVFASAPLSDGPSVRDAAPSGPPATASGSATSGSSSQADSSSRARQPRHRSDDEGAVDHHRVQRARSVAAEPHRQRALAGAAVGLEVADVVDDEDRRRQQPDRHGEHERLPGQPSTCAKYEPVTATTPKNRNTKTSPSPS